MKKIIKKLVMILFAVSLALPAASALNMPEVSVVMASKLKLNITSLYIRPDWYDTLKLGKIPAKKCKWKTSNKTVVKVNKKGRIDSVKPGKATITCTYNGKSYKCKVVVVKELNWNDFAFDPSVDSYYSELGSNCIDHFATVGSKTSDGFWYLGDYISKNMRGLSVGDSAVDVLKKYGESDYYLDKNHNVSEWKSVTEGFSDSYSVFVRTASYAHEYSRYITYDEVDYLVIKVFYFDDADSLLGSICYVTYKNA